MLGLASLLATPGAACVCGAVGGIAPGAVVVVLRAHQLEK